MSVNEPPETTSPVKTVTLPSSRAAQAWDRATDALVAAAESDEAKAKTAYERAKQQYETAAKAANYVRQLRQLARVDGQSMVTTIKAASQSRGSHAGRCAAPNPCNGCDRAKDGAA